MRDEPEADLTPEDHAAAEPLKQRLVDSGMFRRDDAGRLVPVFPANHSNGGSDVPDDR